MANNNKSSGWHIPWSNPLRYVTSRAENVTYASHKNLMKTRLAKATSLFRRDLKSHYGCVNAIEFSNDGLLLLSGGDDRRVLVWNLEKALSDIGEPVGMKGEHNSNIFCLAINNSNTKVYSGGNDEQVVVHDIESGQTEDVFLHEEAVYGLSTDPNNEHIFASACDDGRVLIYDTRQAASTEPFELANYSSSMHAVMYNPAEPRLLATANAKEGLGLWDIRRPGSCLIRYGGSFVQQSCMSVRINSRGSQLVALRRRLPPVLYELSSSQPLCDLDHDGYYNSCTMKSCSFAGPNDEYVISGSDDFNLYMWKIPDDLSQRVYVKEAHMVLRGHRSIVNQVRYNQHNGIIVSSGVEKIIKVWSPFPLKSGVGDIMPESDSSGQAERAVYTHEEYINLVLRSGLVMSHDYSSQSLEEDPRMMAFFDSLVQRELEYWSSDDDLSPSEINLYGSILQVTPPDRHPRSSDSSDTSDNVSPFTLAFASVMAAQETDASRVLAAHEESERVRSTVQAPALDSGGGHSGRSNRKRISEIIAQNRKEVLRAAELRHRSASRMDRSSLLTSLTSDSDSDDAVLAGGGGHPLNKRSAQQQRAAYQLKRLKALRTRLAISDTDNSPDDSPPTRKRFRSGSNSSKEEEASAVKTHCDSAAQPLTDDTLVKASDCGAVSASVYSGGGKGKAGYEREAGPYLQQTDASGHAGHLLPHPEPVAGTSGLTSLPRHSENPATAKTSQDSVHADRPGTNLPASETDGQSGGENSQPVWREFQKFKKRLKKASRSYRQKSKENSQPNNESSDDD